MNTKQSKLGKDQSVKNFLEMDIESLMPKLESERRDSEYLDSLIKSLQSQLLATKTKHKKEIPSKNPLVTKILILEKQIEYETAQFDALKSENSEIRLEINEMRLENMACKKSLSNLTSKIQSSSAKAMHTNQLHREKVTIISNNRTKISDIRSKSVLYKQDIGEKIRDLSTGLSQANSISLGSRQNVRLEKLLNTPNSFNIHKLQIRLQNNWEGFVKQQKQQLVEYCKYIVKLKNGFEDIKNALGITKYDEVVTSFIKGEERNAALYTYLCLLNGQIDDTDALLRENIEKIKYLDPYKFNEGQQMEKLNMLRSKTREIDEKLQSCYLGSAKISDSLQKVFAMFRNIITKLRPFSKVDVLVPEFHTISIADINYCLLRIDEMVEYLQAVLAISYNATISLAKPIPEKSNTNLAPFSYILDQELYMDKDIEDLKAPMQLQDFSTRAEKILKDLTPDITKL